jgi:streptogramin lyase
MLHRTALEGPEIWSVAFGDGAVWALQTQGQLIRLDPATGRVTGRRTFPASQASQVAVGVGGVWVAEQLDAGGSVLVRVDPHTLRKSATVRMPTRVSSASQTRVALGPDAVWWDGVDAGLVWRVDPRTAKILSGTRVTPVPTATTSIAPVGITAEANAVWVTVGSSP